MKTNLSAAVPHHLIAARAYALWLERGRPAGQDYAHWIEAEQQVISSHPAAREEGPADRLPDWADAFGTDIDRALESLAPTYGARSATSL